MSVETCWPVNDGFCGSSRGAAFGGVSAGGDIMPLFDHDDLRARYVNTVANPHWSYLFFFPSDGDGVHWRVYGTKEKSDEYWLPIRTQYLSHSALPGGEDRQTRNSLPAEPLYEGGYGPWIKATLFGNAMTSWVGISRFVVQTTTPDASKQLPQSLDGWSFTDCSGSALADGLELTPDPGESTVVCEYAIGSFSYPPYLYPHLADRVEVDWYATNIAGVTVELVGAYGDRAELEDAPGIEPKPLDATDRRYVGSWAQDHGNLIVSDTGADVASGGGSTGAINDAERVHFLEMLGGMGARALRFTVTVTDPDDPVKIKWPKFHRSESDAHLTYENGHHASLIWPDGPGVRWGQWAWLQNDPTTLLTTPDVFPLGYPPAGWKSSALDWLCWRRVVIEGIERSTNLRTEIQTIYDNYELIGVDTEPSNNNQVYRECDGLTISWLLPYGQAATGVMVNTLAECPPLAVFPSRTRDTAAGYVYDTGYDQVAYTLAQEPRRYVHPREELHVVDPSGPTTWTTALSPQPVDGWHITEHNHVIDNTEGPTFRMVVGAKTFGNASPWHGYFAICLLTEGGGTNVTYDVSQSLRHWRGYIDSGEVVVGWAGNPLGVWQDSATGILADWVHLRVSRTRRDQRLYLWTEEGGEILERSSQDGEAFTMATTINATGRKPAAVIGRNGYRYIYWIDDDGPVLSVYGQIRDPAGNVVKATFATGITDVEDAGIAVDESATSGGQHRLALYVVESGAIVQYTSPDGETFS
jgi:hypothetical protein